MILNKEQLKQYWFVIRELTGRELKRKYSRSYLGVLWSVLNPLFSMAVMSAVFSVMFRRSIENFPIYLLTGNIIWGLFAGATNTSMTALVDNKQLLIKVKLPLQVFTLSRVYTSMMNFGYSFLAYLVFLIIKKFLTHSPYNYYAKYFKQKLIIILILHFKFSYPSKCAKQRITIGVGK